MTRRNAKRFICNTSPSHYEVHDLDNENTNCQIDELIKGGNFKYLDFETKKELEGWFKANSTYDGCFWCLKEYHKK